MEPSGIGHGVESGECGECECREGEKSLQKINWRMDDGLLEGHTK